MKIAVAMSGGVDSSMAAILLKESGHEIVGMSAILFDGIISRHFSNYAPGGSVDAARLVADRYGFPLHRVDLEDEFFVRVVSPFCDVYCNGMTPNPCIYCNAFIKFGSLLRHARNLGCEKLATGHYARLGHSSTGRHYVSRGREISKDQSYFLFMLSQESLNDMMLPLGEYTKEQVRMMARDRGLAAANRPESREICFIPDNRHAEFIERMSGRSRGPGDIEDSRGRVIGRHRGIHRYTVGQRRGLGISAPAPLYVTGLDDARNVVIAGPQSELETSALLAVDIHCMKETEFTDRRVLVKTRSTQKPATALLKPSDDGILVSFDSPQICIAPGQAAVFYNDEMEVLGGGVIARGIPARKRRNGT